MLSEHFSKKEFECPCCHMLSVAMPLVTELEKLRKLVGKPLTITSAYRCSVHNAAVGGAPKSEHVSGLAADVLVPKGITLKAFYALIETLPRFKSGGVGLYPAEGKSAAFIHVDIRDGRARWARIGGKYVGIESVLGNPVGGGKA